jgi:hypothetical protein
MPHFQLVTTDGDVLGARELGRPEWPPGSDQLANVHLEQLLDFVTEPDQVLGVEAQV